MQALELAAGFAPGTQADWRQLVDKALKGASYDRLRSVTDDGSPIEPLYAGRRDVAAVSGRPAAQPWTVVTRISHPSPAIANRMILDDLNGGAGGIDLVLSSSSHARGSGVAIETLADLEQLLDGVHLDLVSLHANAGYESRPLLAMLLALAEKRGLAPSMLDIRPAADPIARMIQRGSWVAPLEWYAPRIQDLLHHCDETGLTGPVGHADGRVWHAAGASGAQELAYTLATAVSYLRIVDEAGIVDAPQDRIDVALAADADQFGTIAKFRAMRHLWARVLDASGLEQRPLHIHAETAWRMMTRRDPWVNMLRGTVAAFAAGVGGADSVTVLPFTEALGLPDAFARRIARNIQTILLEESNVYRVADPAAGSGAVEARTQQLVQEAWALFQEAEAAGGIERAYVEGKIAPGIARVRDERMQRVATRRDPLTGTSAFANLNEAPVNVLEADPVDLSVSARPVALPAPGKGVLTRALMDAARDGATMAEMTVARDAASRTDVEALPPMRLAAPFETLRDAADRYREAKGAPPRVFLATLGGASDHAARSGWARTLFAAGGIEAVIDTVAQDASDDVTAMAAAFADSGARVACVCSSDALYAEHAEALTRALRDAGARAVYLAGRPGDRGDALTDAGLTGFLYEGCDVIAALRHVHDVLDLG